MEILSVLLMLVLSCCAAQQDASMQIGVASGLEPEDFVAEDDLAELVSTVRQCDFLGRFPSRMLFPSLLWKLIALTTSSTRNDR
jgi:hypothetical protein